MGFKPPNSGGGGLQQASITLTNAQILGLVATPVQVVAAPGSGKMIAPVFVSLIANLTAAYTNIDTWNPATSRSHGGLTLALDAGNQFNQVCSTINGGALLGTTGEIYSWAVPFLWAGGSGVGLDAAVVYVDGSQEDVSLGWTDAALSLAVLSNTGGAFTGGDPANTLTVTCWYVLVPV